MSEPPKPEGDVAPEDDADRRRHPRARLSLLIQFRFDTLDDFLTEYAIDISTGGMFIRTDQPHEEGSVLFLQFALRDGNRLLEGLGRVVWVNPPGDPAREAGMGIEFLNLDNESRELIEEIVAHKREHAPAPR